MSAKHYATLHNVKGEQVPPEWAKELGLDIESEPDVRYDVVFKRIHARKRKKAPFEQILKTVERLQAVPVINPDFTEESLYDEHGLPK